MSRAKKFLSIIKGARDFDLNKKSQRKNLKVRSPDRKSKRDREKLKLRSGSKSGVDLGL